MKALSFNKPDPKVTETSGVLLVDISGVEPIWPVRAGATAEDYLRQLIDRYNNNPGRVRKEINRHAAVIPEYFSLRQWIQALSTQDELGEVVDNLLLPLTHNLHAGYESGMVLAARFEPIAVCRLPRQDAVLDFGQHMYNLTKDVRCRNGVRSTQLGHHDAMFQLHVWGAVITDLDNQQPVLVLPKQNVQFWTGAKDINRPLREFFADIELPKGEPYLPLARLMLGDLLRRGETFSKACTRWFREIECVGAHSGVEVSRKETVIRDQEAAATLSRRTSRRLVQALPFPYKNPDSALNPAPGKTASAPEESAPSVPAPAASPAQAPPVAAPKNQPQPQPQPAPASKTQAARTARKKTMARKFTFQLRRPRRPAIEFVQGSQPEATSAAKPSINVDDLAQQETEKADNVQLVLTLDGNPYTLITTL